MKNKGFTLIELSIVLVVVALIIGSVIQGQQIIENARLSRIAKEVTEIKTAFNNFKLKYNAIPGDMDSANTMWASANNGDGDGSVDKPTDEMGETAEFWNQMALSSVYPGSYSLSLSSGAFTHYQAGVQMPVSKFKSNAGYLYYNPATSADSLTVFTKVGNVLELGGCATSSQSGTFKYCSAGIMTGQRAEQLDKKIDDGEAATGSMMGVNALTALATHTSGCSADYTDSTAAYNVTSDVEACRLFFWMEEPEN